MNGRDQGRYDAADSNEKQGGAEDTALGNTFTLSTGGRDKMKLGLGEYNERERLVYRPPYYPLSPWE